METFPEDMDAAYKNYYADFQPARESAIEKENVFTEALTFSFHHYRYFILNYFQSIERTIVFPNFSGDIEVWFEDKTSLDKIYKLYDNFTIKVQYKQVTQGYKLVLAYNGTSNVLRQSLADITDFDTDKYNLINCNGSLYKYENIPEAVKQYQ